MEFLGVFLVFCRSVSRGSQVWAPEGSTAFKCLLSARFCAALLSNISDCDETFNYWEPVSDNPERLRLVRLRALQSSSSSRNTVFLNVLTDALLAVRHRDADVGVFSSVRHQVIRLPVATCSPGLFARTRSTDEQGTFHYYLSWIAVFAVCPDKQMVFIQKERKKERKGLCCRYWCSTSYDVS